MDEQLLAFINDNKYLGSIRNVDPVNPVIMEKTPDHRTFIVVVSYLEPTFSQIPYNVLWVVYDPADPDYNNVLRRVDHNGSTRRGTWERITTYSQLWDTDQYYRIITETDPFVLGINWAGIGAATTTISGLVTLKDPQAEQKVIHDLDDRLSDARDPNPHSHPDFPRTMLHIDGSYTEDQNYEDLVGDGEIFVSVDPTIVPKAGEMLFLTTQNPTRLNEWYAEWRAPTRNDVIWELPHLIQLNIIIPAGANFVGDNTTADLIVDAIFEGGEKLTDPPAATWSIDVNSIGVTIDSATGLLTVPDLSGDSTVTVRVQMEDPNYPGDIVHGDLVITLRDNYSDRTINSLEIIGPSTSAENVTQSYTFQVTYSDLSTELVTPLTVNSNNPVGAFTTDGQLVIGEVASDTTITLSASYTDGTTVTDTHDVLISADILPSYIMVEGATSMNEQTTETYVVRMYFTDGTNEIVTPDTFTSGSPLVGEIVAATGILTAKDISTDSTVTINAEYTRDGVTMTDSHDVNVIADIELQSIAINGPATVTELLTGSYTILATYTDGSTKTVAATSLSTSDTNVGTITLSGTLTAKEVAADTPLTINASVTEDGVTKTADRAITVLDVPAPIVQSIAIVGPSSVDEESTTAYTFTVTMSDSSTKTVTPVTLSGATDGTFSVGGSFVAPAITTGKNVTLNVSYTEDGETVTDTHVVAIANTDNKLTGLALTGPASIQEEGGVATLTATASYEDGTTSNVTVPSTYAITAGASHGALADNKFTAGAVTGDQSVTVRATYVEGGVTQTADHTFSVLDVPVTVTGISISGAATMAENGSESYTVTANYSDGSSAVVTPDVFTWNKPTAADWTVGTQTLAGKSVTSSIVGILTAEYTETGSPKATDTHNVTIQNTIKVPVSVAISGASTMDENTSEAYSITITYDDGSTGPTTLSTITWSVSSGGAYLAYNTNSWFDANEVTGDKSAVISASVQLAGYPPFTDTHNVTIVDKTLTPTSLVVSGPAQGDENTGPYAMIATVGYSDGSSAVVTNPSSWTIVGNNQGASISSTGSLTLPSDVAGDVSITVQASYTEAGSTVTDTAPFLIKNVASGITPRWGVVDQNSTGVAAYDQAFADSLTNSLTGVNGESFTVPGSSTTSGNGKFAYMMYPKELGFLYTQNQFATPGSWDGANDYGTWVFDGPATATIGGKEYYVYRNDFPFEAADYTFTNTYGATDKLSGKP